MGISLAEDSVIVTYYKLVPRELNRRKINIRKQKKTVEYIVQSVASKLSRITAAL